MSERMTSQQSIELTIRTATLIKSVSKLIGVHDAVVASLIVNECIDQFKQLAEFTLKLKG